MKSSFEIIRDFKEKHGLDDKLINEFLDDWRVPESERNIHDSIYLSHLESIVEFIKEGEKES